MACSHPGAPVAREREPLLPPRRQEQEQDPALAPLPLHGQQQRPREAGDGDARARPADGGGKFPWVVPFAVFAYLTLSCVLAVHRSWPDAGAAAFIGFAYADLLLLFWCLRRYERSEPGSALRERLKVAVWLLTSALTLLFSYKVADVMPAPVAALVWVMGLATVCGGFLAFFCFEKTT